jgi:hypothetical protein
MDKLSLLLPLLACPLMMLAMGAIGWFTAKVLRRDRAAKADTAKTGTRITAATESS